MMTMPKIEDCTVEIIYFSYYFRNKRIEGMLYIPSRKKSCTDSWQFITMIVGYFSLIVSFVIPEILDMISEYINNCSNMPPEEALATCKLCPDNLTTALNIMRILTVLNGLQFGCSLSLIWNAFKEDTKSVTVWFIISVTWTYSYSIMAFLYVVSVADTEYVFNLSVFAIFLFVIIIIGMFMVLSFRQDMPSSPYLKMKVFPPPS